MPKKLLLKITAITSLTVWLISCTPCQSQDSAKYTLSRWQAVNLIEDAFKKRILDTLVDSLQFRVQILETEKKVVYTSFNKQIAGLRQVQLKQSEIIGYQESLTSYYKLESRKYKTQRDIGITAVIAYTVVRIGVKVFKPP